jgi:hypothetical protein
MRKSLRTLALLCATLPMLWQTAHAGPVYPDPASTSIRGEALVAQEQADPFTVGGLKLGQSQTEVLAILGEPPSKIGPQLEQATGLYVTQWVYADRGLGVNMAAESEAGPFSLQSVIMEEPCDLKGISGLGIGMPQEQAMAAINGLLGAGVSRFDVGHETDLGVLFEDAYIVLSVRCLDGVVKHFYLGPGPE